MTMNLKGTFSERGTFHASYVTKLGRSEVQIHPIKKNELDHSLALTFPISSNSEIVHMQWTNVDSSSSATKESNGSSKKRRADDSVSENNGEFTYLTVILKNGSILLYSPFRQELVNEFQANASVIACHFPSSRLRNAVWILYSQEVVLFELNEFKVLKKINLVAKNINNASSLIELNVNDKTCLLLTSDEGLTAFDISNKKVHTHLALNHTGKFNSIITTQDDLLIVSTTNAIYVISLPDFELVNTINYQAPIQSIFTTKAASSFGIIFQQDLQIELVSGVNNSKKQPVSKSITLTNSLNGTILSTLYQGADSQLFISWFDYELRLELVQARDLKKAKHTIDLSSYGKTKSKNTANEHATFQISAPRELTVAKEFEVTRESELISLLEQNKDDTFKTLQILVSNADKIKSTAVKLNEETAQRLFKTIAFRLELQPSESTLLNEWLKWILLSHQQVVSHPANKLNLKNLKRELSKSTKNLPGFLGLQGRLELLRAQLQLRNQISRNVEDEDFQLVKDNAVKAAEKDIVYVNGENDDNEEEIDVAAGDVDENDDEEEDAMDIDDDEDDDSEDEDEDEEEEEENAEED